MGLRPPMVNLPHESWDRSAIGGRRPIMGGPRGRSPPSIFTGKLISINRSMGAAYAPPYPPANGCLMVIQNKAMGQRKIVSLLPLADGK